MSRTAILLQVLPAAYGDCLLIECPVGKRTWRMLVDTGPDDTYPVLRSRLAAIKPNAKGRRHIDLFVVTHIDHDHIGSAGRLLADRSLKLDFGDVWFNAPGQRRVRGVKEGQALADMLGAPGIELPWNRAFGGGHVVTPAEQFVEVATGRGAPRLTLLSPTPERLTRLFKVWERELAKLAQPQEPKVTKPLPRAAFDPDLAALAKRTTTKDRAVANGSSIALLLEHRGASVLLAADAFAPVLATALQSMGHHRGASLPLQLTPSSSVITAAKAISRPRCSRVCRPGTMSSVRTAPSSGTRTTRPSPGPSCTGAADRPCGSTTEMSATGAGVPGRCRPSTHTPLDTLQSPELA